MKDKEIEPRTIRLRDVSINTGFIWTDRDRCGGMPCLRNHRITVSQLLGELAKRGSIDKICDAFSIMEDELKGMLQDLSRQLWDDVDADGNDME